MRTRKSRSIGLLGLAVILIALTTTGAGPAPADIPAGTWTGYLEQTASITNTVSGVDIYANSEGKGNLNLEVDAQGNVTGVFGAYKAKVVWGAPALGGQQECGWTAVADVTGTVALNAAHLPVWSLKLKLRPAESSSYCNPKISGTSMSPWETLLLEAATFSGGKMTGTKIESGPQSTDAMFAQLAGLGAKIVHTTYWELNSSSANVALITPEYEQYFLENITLQNTYTALIDWHDNTPGTVHFALAGQWQDVPGEAEVSATFNVGQVPTGTNPLEVTAVTSDGQSSPPLTYDVIIVPLEPWAEKAYFSVAQKVNQVPQNFVLYRGTTQVPQKPLVLPFLDLSGIPVLGDVVGKWGVPPFQVDVNLEATSAGGLSNAAPVTGTAGFYLGGDKPNVKMTVSGEAFTDMTPTALLFDHGQANFHIDPASIDHTFGLVDLIPAAAELYSIPVVGSWIQSANTALGVTVKLTASGDGKATLAVRPDQSELYFNTGTISPVVEITGQPSIGIPKVLWGAVGVTGKGKFTIEIAPNPSLNNCAVSLYASAHVVVIGILDKIYKSPDYLIAQCAPTTLNGRPALAVVVPPELARRLRAQTEASPGEHEVLGPAPQRQAGEEILAEGVAPYAEMDLALGPDSRMAFAFTPGDPAAVSVRFFDGDAWGSPVPLSQSPYTGFSPSVEFNDKGEMVAVWVESDGAPHQQDLAGLARSWEIAFAVVQPDGTVSARGSLTQDEVVDFAPHLGRARDGSLWIAWVKSPATELWGPADSPNQLWAARWNGDGWGSAELVTDELVGNLSFDLAAIDDAKALLVTDMDRDGDPGTAEDRELFAYARSAGGWAAPVRLTDNDLLDAFPLAAYGSDGSPVITWLQDGAVIAVEGDLQDAPQPWDVAPEGGRVELAGGQLIAGADGALDLMWSGFSPEGLGIWRAHRPGRNQPWGSPQVIVDGTAGIGALTASQSAGDELWLGYSKLDFGPEAAGDLTAARLPVSSDLAVLQVGAEPSESAEPPSGTTPDRPSGLNCLGIGAALPMAVALYTRRRRSAKAAPSETREDSPGEGG
jgi:hypothetical protein